MTLEKYEIAIINAMMRRKHLGVMDFGDALKAIKKGKKALRVSWNDLEGWLVYVDGAACDVMSGGADELLSLDTLESSPFIGMITTDNKLTPYTPTQADMLADDWLIAESATIAGLEKS